MRTPDIKVKNINSYKYAKNKIMLNDLDNLDEKNIDMVVLIEQGNDVVTINKVPEELEYAVVKVYFKNKWKDNKWKLN